MPGIHRVPLKVAIVGAGMAGLACADALAESGATVTLFDKGHRPGGRMSTRRLETPIGEAAFDFGAQYFTAHDPAFVAQIGHWAARGLVAPWPQAGQGAWVGVPAMNVLVASHAFRHDVRFNHMVRSLERDDNGWHVIGADFRSGAFDAAVLALPAEQTAPLLTLHDFTLAQAAVLGRSQPCWMAMFAFSAPLPGADVLRDCGIIAWAARNNSKPGRTGPESWVVQATADWSAARLELAPDLIGPRLLAALNHAKGAGTAGPVLIAHSVHRWRHGLSAGTGDGALWNPTTCIGACGDWLFGPRVECAWLSGRALASRMLQTRKVTAAAAVPA